MKAFYHVLANTLVVNIANGYVWFALTFWAFLETKSVLATSIIGGVYLVLTVLSSIWFGSIVDHNKKKTAMQYSNLATLFFFIIGAIFYYFTSEAVFRSVTNWEFWFMVVVILSGAIAGNIRNITLPTLVTLLVKEDKRDKANGLSGTVFGLSFTICFVISGLLLGFFGMFWVIVTGVLLLLLATIHLTFITIPEKHVIKTEVSSKKIDIQGTIKIVRNIPGLFPLIFFGTFNNFLGGVFMALMDAYALSLVSVQIWGIVGGIVSSGFIVGGLLIAKRGLGKNPVATIFKTNIILWIVSILFVVQPNIILYAAGMFVYMALFPFIEASEQTVIQKVVPSERQGRVFGFAQSLEQAASPLTAFLIGPLAQFFFIPFMTNGAGVELIGSWFGTGQGRGIALVFITAGFIGLVVTVLAMRLPAYKMLSARYEKPH